MKYVLKEILMKRVEYPTEYKDLSYFLDFLRPDYKRMISALDILKKDKLYPKKIHGLYHSEKVFFFAYIIGKLIGLNATDMQIIIDAALYHDIGRSNDSVDDFHGYAATLRIEQLLDNEIYCNEENAKILKAIIDGHSLDDRRKQFIFESYEIKDYDRFNCLYCILKDADALDRARFSEEVDSHLDKSFLRLGESIKLIDVARQINAVYNFYLDQKRPNDFSKLLNYGQSHCYHSVGFDFFKFSSILKTGILSKKEMMDLNIAGTINFVGGNLNNWISVISLKHINKNSTNSGYVNFTRHGIGFYCQVDDMYEGCSIEEKYDAIENGIPFDHSGYKDEKFVHGKIPIDRVQQIFIPKKYIEADIRNLRYVYNSFSYDIMRERIRYIFDNVEKNGVLTKRAIQQMNIYLQQYKEIIKELGYIREQPSNEQNKLLKEKTEIINIEINKIIQSLIYEDYCRELGIQNGNKVSVLEVVTWELKKAGFDFDIVYDEDGVHLSINNHKEIGKEKNV